jgi:serine/threonine protein kinase
MDPTNDGKVSLDIFQFIKRLGKGGFGTVVLAKGGPEELYAVKALEKQNITSISISEIFAEKEALLQTSGYLFITTLFSCFQNKVCLNF